MKKISSLLLFIFSFSFFTFVNAQTGTWTALTNLSPNPNNGVMLLLTDGTVICFNSNGLGYGTGWDKLTPDINGSYINGTWTSIADMNYDRLAFSSQVLPNGQVYVAGGEYGAGGNYGEVYDPVADAWTVCGNIPPGWNVYDAPSELLYNGNILEGPEIGAAGGQPCNSILQWSPSTFNYINENAEPGNHDEAQWIKLPDSSVLTVSMPYPNYPVQDSSVRYIPQTNTWIIDSMTPSNIYDQYGFESGPAFMLPNGKAIFFGAAQYNDIYTPTGHATPGRWAAAANFPMISGTYVGQPDAPGAMMVNGHILLAVSPIGTNPSNEFQSPTWFVEYDYITNTFTQVTSNLPTVGADSLAGDISQQCTFLDLPDGNVLMGVNQTSNSQQYFIYTPGSAAIPQGKPTINSILPYACPSYKITGKLFNGISEGAAFGDDWQMATNYPIVRLTDGSNVYYAKTTNWNRVGALQTDSLEDTAIFTLPSMPGGTYSLVVVANGNPSNPVLFNVFGVSLTSQTDNTCYGNTAGSATMFASGGISPYTYSWSPSGGTNATASNLSAGVYTITATDNNGCSTIATATITAPGQLLVFSDSINVTSAGACTGQASVFPSGGTLPYTYLWAPGGATTSTISSQCQGMYCCTITDANGCSLSTCVTILNTAGVQNINANNGGIEVYPNPNNGHFIIQSSLINTQCSVEIYNVLGQRVYSNPFAIFGSQLSINMSNQPNGIYLYRVITENGNLSGEGKIILQK